MLTRMCGKSNLKLTCTFGCMGPGGGGGDGEHAVWGMYTYEETYYLYSSRPRPYRRQVNYNYN